MNNLQHAIIDSGYISSLDTNQLRDILALCKRYNEELKKDNLVQFADQGTACQQVPGCTPGLPGGTLRFLSISWWMNFRTVMMASLTRSNVFALARHLRVLWWLAMTLSPFTLSAIHRRIILSISLRKWV